MERIGPQCVWSRLDGSGHMTSLVIIAAALAMLGAVMAVGSEK
jgi:hypothetical protein